MMRLTFNLRSAVEAYLEKRSEMEIKADIWNTYIIISNTLRKLTWPEISTGA